MPSPVALAKYFFLMACLSLVTAPFVWHDARASVMLLTLSAFCSFVRAIMEVFSKEVAAAPFFPVITLPTLPKGVRVVIFGAIATLVFLYLPTILRHTIDPHANGFTADTTGAASLGAFQFFAALSIAYAAWRGLFPGFYAYAAETMEGKLLESITADLLKALTPDPLSFADLDLAAERRKIATLQFTTRCARFVFSVAPFVFFFVQANHALASALTAVPGSVPGL